MRQQQQQQFQRLRTTAWRINFSQLLPCYIGFKLLVAMMDAVLKHHGPVQIQQQLLSHPLDSRISQCPLHMHHAVLLRLLHCWFLSSCRHATDNMQSTKTSIPITDYKLLFCLLRKSHKPVSPSHSQLLQLLTADFL
jgi:hypothetical protein